MRKKRCRAGSERRYRLVAGVAGAAGATGAAAGAGFTYKLGEVGPGGGPVFFVDYFDQFPGFKYLEASPADLTAVAWCSDTTNSIAAVSGWAANTVGTGQANTTAMLSTSPGGLCTSGAANSADTYVSPNSTSDWFLPSLGEMMLMYTNLRQAGVGGFASSFYWSSTEDGATNAWFQYFFNGVQNSYNKVNTSPVRAARAFS